ncbi:MAG: hypothetical protein ACRC1W_01265 [Shewanella sp.]
MATVVMPSVSAVHDVVTDIMCQVATLTPPAQVGKPVVIFIPIQVRRGKHHDATRFGMGSTIFSMAVRELWRTFTAIQTIICNRSSAYKAND